MNKKNSSSCSIDRMLVSNVYNNLDGIHCNGNALSRRNDVHNVYNPCRNFEGTAPEAQLPMKAEKSNHANSSIIIDNLSNNGDKRNCSMLNFSSNNKSNNLDDNDTLHKKLKRQSDECIVSGRSLKRLRLDHHHHHAVVHVTNNNDAVGVGGVVDDIIGMRGVDYSSVGISSAQSTGTLSMGTMGDDLESNDESNKDASCNGNPREETLDCDDGYDEGEGSESGASSWVASLPSLSSNLRRRQCATVNNRVTEGEDANISSFLSSSTLLVLQQPSLHSLSKPKVAREDDGNGDDDEATCSAMTTAAVAPRRRHHHRTSTKRGEGQGGGVPSYKRHEIGFMMNAPAPSVAAGSDRDSRLKNRKKKNQEKGVEVGVDSLALDGTNAAAAAASRKTRSDATNANPFHNNVNMSLKRELEHEECSNNRETKMRTYSPYPPVDCIPHPLLVAAQHAAGGGMETIFRGSNTIGTNAMESSGGTEAGVSFQSKDMGNMATAASSSTTITSAQRAGASDWSVLLMGDCCSSVTEEETSLAEDEASLSAISIGGNTTFSAGGITVKTALSDGGGEARSGSAKTDENGQKGEWWSSVKSLASAEKVGGLLNGTSKSVEWTNTMACVKGGRHAKKHWSLFSRSSSINRSDSQGSAESMEEVEEDTGNENIDSFNMEPYFDHDRNTMDTNLLKSNSDERSMRPEKAKSSDSGNPSLTSEYASLNQLLGGLHKERQHRCSSHHPGKDRPFSRRELSLQSIGIEGADGSGGTGRLCWDEEERSHRSWPGEMPKKVNTSSSWNVSLQQHLLPPDPPPFEQHEKPLLKKGGQNDVNAKPSPLEKDTEIGETGIVDCHGIGTIVGAGNISGGESVLGTSVASLYGSLTGSGGNLSQTSSCSAGTALAIGEDSKSVEPKAVVPKWKRRVNLPSHSSLY